MTVRATQTTGLIPYSRQSLHTCLDTLARRHAIRPGMTFLDLGAGKADMMIVAAQQGLHAYGIEINEDHTLQARKAIAIEKDKGSLPDTPCNIATGSYYPRDYITLRTQGKTSAPRWEDDHFYIWYGIDLAIPEVSVKKARDFFFPLASEIDPYQELGINFSDIDIFFSYTWGIELPSQLEMFSLYAKNTALFLNESATPPVHHDQMVAELGLTYTPIRFPDWEPERRGRKGGNILAYKKGETPTADPSSYPQDPASHAHSP